MWNRRRFLEATGGSALAAWAGARPARHLTLFLGGDVMTGRGIDQVLPRPSKPRIHEPYMNSALGYVELAERAHGAIARPASFSYVWGDALAWLESRAPDLRVINLETSVTTSDEPVPKGINYRMHPDNVPCLVAAAIDCCVLANNHVLDWGLLGLLQSLQVLRGADLNPTGAGHNADEAGRPAVLEATGSRVLVFGFASPTSGVPRDWAATPARAGVNLLPDLSTRTASRTAEQIQRWRRPGDVVVASIHWGGNWGYAIPPEQREFAQRLVDEGAADLLHGHSSHHSKGIEVYRGRPILYGCGDLLNDYEGISGQEEFRNDLVLAYLVAFDSSGSLSSLEMTPFRIRRFRLERARREDAEWLRATLDREGRGLGTRVERKDDDTLTLRWS